jgi:hypothetical protein
MDISGRIRALLAGLPLESRPRDVFAVAAEQVIRGRPREVRGFEVSRESRWAYEAMGKTLMLRMDASGARSLVEARGQVETLIRAEGSEPARLLWGHWILTLGEHLQGGAEDDGLKGELWKRAFASQGAGEGPLHVVTAETLLDAFVYDELLAIHAGYNSARLMGDSGMMDSVRRAVRWHVKNTQPDHTTQEPWGLAAFAELDETGTFAEQQLHDAAVGLRGNAEWPADRVPVAVGLLADAVMTMDNLAH